MEENGGEEREGKEMDECPLTGLFGGVMCTSMPKVE
jgi:hypothetical protein